MANKVVLRLGVAWTCCSEQDGLGCRPSIPIPEPAWSSCHESLLIAMQVAGVGLSGVRCLVKAYEAVSSVSVRNERRKAGLSAIR